MKSRRPMSDMGPAAVLPRRGFALALAEIRRSSLLPCASLKLCRGSGTKTALCRLPGIAPRSKESPMISGAYLRQQAEILIAMSRATLDLGMAGRLREMASELQARAAEQEDKRGSNDNELANVRPPFRIGS
jgi:hypothetical protein